MYIVTYSLISGVARREVPTASKALEMWDDIEAAGYGTVEVTDARGVPVTREELHKTEVGHPPAPKKQRWFRR